eukprot:jgi/Bigna1/80102/fgenesh1_pg.67_\
MRLGSKLSRNGGGKSPRNRSSSRTTGPLGVLNPATLEFEGQNKDVRLKGEMSVYTGMHWKRSFGVLRKGCIFQYNDKNEAFAAAAVNMPLITYRFLHPVTFHQRLCISYLESLPLSLDDDISRPNPYLFTLPLKDRSFVFGVKSRSQELWFSLSSRQETDLWIQSIVNEGVQVIRPPKGLLKEKGKHGEDAWQRISAQAAKRILKCRTDDELFKVSQSLSFLQISALKPETRSIILDIREAALDQKKSTERRSINVSIRTDGEGAAVTAGNAIEISSSSTSNNKIISESIHNLQDTCAKEMESPSISNAGTRIYSNRKPREITESHGSPPPCDTSEINDVEKKRGGRRGERRSEKDVNKANQLSVPFSVLHQRKRSANLRKRAELHIKTGTANASLPAGLRSPENKDYAPKDEVFVTDSNGRVKRTGVVVRRVSNSEYEVKCGGHSSALKTLNKDRLFKIPTVDFQWRKGKVIGQGQYGVVCTGMNMQRGSHIAIKQMPFRVGRSKSALRALFREVRLMQLVDHPNIVKFLGCEICMAEKALYIFMEQVSGGSLVRVLNQFGALPENVTRGYTTQILMGLEYLHLKGVVHRDLKCANVLITTDGVCKLADFGVSKQIKDDCQNNALQTAIGSPYWMAPEVILEDGYGRTADIWSLGCTIIEMLTATHPWKKLDNPYTACYSIAQSQDLPYVPPQISSQMLEFIHVCLKRDKEKRPSCSELWRMEWLMVDSPTEDKHKLKYHGNDELSDLPPETKKAAHRQKVQPVRNRTAPSASASLPLSRNAENNKAGELPSNNGNGRACSKSTPVSSDRKMKRKVPALHFV